MKFYKCWSSESASSHPPNLHVKNFLFRCSFWRKQKKKNKNVKKTKHQFSIFFKQSVLFHLCLSCCFWRSFFFRSFNNYFLISCFCSMFFHCLLFSCCPHCACEQLFIHGTLLRHCRCWDALWCKLRRVPTLALTTLLLLLLLSSFATVCRQLVPLCVVFYTFFFCCFFLQLFNGRTTEARSHGFDHCVDRGVLCARRFLPPCAHFHSQPPD